MNTIDLPDKGLHHLRRLLSDEPGLDESEVDRLLRAAALRARIDTFSSADRIARRAVALFPRALGPRLFLGRLLCEQGQPRALRVLQQVLGEAITTADTQAEAAALYLLGRHLHREGQIDQARGVLGRALTLLPPGPHLHNAMVELATVEEDAGEAPAAIALLRQALSVAESPDLVYAAREVLARVLYGAGQHAEALEVLQPVLDDMPTHYELEIAALIHMALGHTEEVLSLLGQAARQAVSLGDREAAANLLVLKARARSDLGDDEGAWENLQSARTRMGMDGPGDVPASASDRGHCAIQCAVVSQRQGRPDDARVHLQEAADLLAEAEPDTWERVQAVLAEHAAGSWTP